LRPGAYPVMIFFPWFAILKKPFHYRASLRSAQIFVTSLYFPKVAAQPKNVVQNSGAAEKFGLRVKRSRYFVLLSNIWGLFFFSILSVKSVKTVILVSPENLFPWNPWIRDPDYAPAWGMIVGLWSEYICKIDLSIHSKPKTPVTIHMKESIDH